MRRVEYRVRVDSEVWLHCAEVGDEDSPVVLINNACFMSRDFDALADRYRLVFIDSRGRGGSAPVVSADQVSGDAVVDDLEVVRQHLGVSIVHVIGWSAGGASAAAYAMDYPVHVDRVLTIGWLPPRHSPPTAADQAEQQERARQRIPTAAIAAVEALRAEEVDRSDPARYARESFFGNAAFQTPRPELLRTMRSEPWIWPNEQGQHWRQVMTWMQESPRRHRSGVLTAPTLVVYGDGDRGSLRAARDWRWDHRATRLLVMSGVGHYPWLEAPEVFFGIVREFLKGAWPAGCEEIKGESPAAGQ